MTAASDVVIRFANLPAGGSGWYDPNTRVVLVDRNLSGRDLAETVLHEMGHVLLGDDASLDDEQHDLLEEWAKSSASLLGLVRPEASLRLSTREQRDV